MGATVIDQLTVKFGLDPADFKKGIDESKKAMDELKGSAASSGATVGNVLETGAKKATGGLGKLGAMLGRGGAVGLGIGAALYLGKKLDDTLFNVALSLRQVAIDGKNLGQTAAGMRNLQNMSVLAGGAIEDAADSVNGLQSSLFNLRFNGQVSDQIVMLSRLGVQFQDSYGRARDFNDVMLDTADALEKAQKNGEMTRPEAFQFAQQAGFTGGMAQLVLSGKANVQAELNKQRARTQINQEMTTGATDWVRASLSMGQAAEAEIGNKGVGLVGETRAKADQALERAGTEGTKLFGQALDFLGDAAHKAGDALMGLVHSAESVIENKNPTGRSSSAVGRPEAWVSTVRAAAKRNGVPEDLLMGLLRTESNFNPNAVNAKTGAAGIAQILPSTGKDLGIVPGKSPSDDIDAAARYLRQLHDQAAVSGFADKNDVMPWVAATSAYHAGLSNVRSGHNIGPESLAYPGKVLQGTPYEEAAAGFQPGAGNVSNDVQIQQITVNTQATDAEGLANDVGAAMRRKLLAAQAEGGIQ